MKRGPISAAVAAILFSLVSLSFAQTFLPNTRQPSYSGYAASTESAFGPNIAIFTTTGANTWTVPEGVTSIRVTVIAGGGGGGGGFQNASGGGGGGAGGSGGGWWRAPMLVQPGTICDITVGAGGTAGTGGTSPTNGGQGGISSINGACALFPIEYRTTNSGAGLAGQATNGGNGGASPHPAFGSGGTGVAGNSAAGSKSSATTTLSFLSDYIIPSTGGASGAGTSGTAGTGAAVALITGTTITGNPVCTAPAGCGGGPSYLFIPVVAVTGAVGNANAGTLTLAQASYGAGGGGGGGGTTGGNGAAGTQGIVIIEY